MSAPDREPHGRIASRDRWTIQQLLAAAVAFLSQLQIEQPRLTAEILLAHALGTNRLRLYLEFDRPLDVSERGRYRELIRRRAQGEPVAYITGQKEFWSLSLAVAPGVLIPRPETEILVERALKVLADAGGSSLVLELGTGSGAVAVVLAKERPGARIWATDISPAALAVAGANARRHGVGDRIRFLEGDLWEPVRDLGLRFDVVVSNPPYVAATEWETLPREVSAHEPRTALDGGINGLDCIARILSRAPDFLKAGGGLLLEMDPRQTEEVLARIAASGAYDRWARHRDLSGQWRVVSARRREETGPCQRAGPAAEHADG